MKIRRSREKEFRDIPDGMAPRGLSACEPPRWEYRSLLLPRLADLSQHGAEGWELVSVIAQPADQAAYYFRRKKQ
jgi:hypothetical protein